MKEEEIKKIINKSIQEYDMKRNDYNLVQLQNIFGMVRTIDDATDLANIVAETPQNFYEQLLIDTSTATKKLYIYDTVGSVWYSVTIT